MLPFLPNNYCITIRKRLHFIINCNKYNINDNIIEYVYRSVIMFDLS